jgi:hypothetical protein
MIIEHETPIRSKIRANVAAWAFEDEPTLSSIDLHRPPPAPSIPGTPLGTKDNARELGDLVGVALGALRTVLEVPLPQTTVEETATIGRLHISAAEKVLNTQVRVDDNLLRRHAIVQHEMLLAEAETIEASLPG